MIKCPACGTENNDGSNFCIACGIDLTNTATDNMLRTDSVAEPTASTVPNTSPSVDMPREYLDTTPPPPPPPPSFQAPPPVYGPNPTFNAPPAATIQPPKQRVLAMALEIGLGLFSLPGIGWLYAGNTTTGVLWLVGFLVAQCLLFTLDVVTIGFGTCIHVPIWIGVIIVSSIMLYNYTKQHPESFGP